MKTRSYKYDKVNKELQIENKLFLRYANSKTIFNIAVCYENGDGVDKDMIKAIELYTLSAYQCNAKAQYNLAICYTPLEI